MSAINKYHFSLVADSKVEEEHCKSDSGFLSSENLIYSEDISSETIRNEGSSQSSEIYEGSQKDLQGDMRVDSGIVDLSENFSDMRLTNSDLNDLGSEKVTAPVQEEHPWEIYYKQDEDGDTQLHLAIMQGYPEAVLALIRSAPSSDLLDIPNDDAITPLHLAVALQQWRLARWLIVAGAQPRCRNLRGDSPLHLAASLGDLQCCKAIVEPVRSHERDFLHLKYSTETYHLLDLDQWNFDGQTCVHVAALNGHIDVLRYLVNKGADINSREGKGGYTVLHYAAEKEDERLIYFLLFECKRLDATTSTYGGLSALQLGLSLKRHLEQILRSKGVPSPYSSDDEDWDFSEEEINYENKPQVLTLVNANA